MAKTSRAEFVRARDEQEIVKLATLMFGKHEGDLPPTSDQLQRNVWRDGHNAMPSVMDGSYAPPRSMLDYDRLVHLSILTTMTGLIYAKGRRTDLTVGEIVVAARTLTGFKKMVAKLKEYLL